MKSGTFLFNILLILAISLTAGCTSSKVEPEPEKSTVSSTWLKADTVEPAAINIGARLNGLDQTDDDDDWRDEIIYFIMTDRFFDGSSNSGLSFVDETKINPNYYHGGDLQGILDKQEYIRKLGMTSVWITPVVKNAWEDAGSTGYHGYWAQDFTVVDPHLAADNAAFTTFVNGMHAQGLLVIQDIVVNHTGNNLKYEDGANSGWTPVFDDDPSDLVRIFVDDAYPRPNINNEWVDDNNRIKPVPFNQLSYYNNNGQMPNGAADYSAGSIKGDLSGLDDLKTTDATVRTMLADVYKDWIARGVDGFRIDTVKHVEEDFWDDFVPDVVSGVSGSKKFLMFGEALIGSHSGTARYTKDGSGNPRLDSLLNFELYYRIRDVFRNGGATSLLTQELNNRSVLRQTSNPNAGVVSADDGTINFIDNHDESRFMSQSNATQNNLWLSLMYIMTTKGIPCIYYNTENETTGDAQSGRKDMPNFNTTNKKTFTLIRKLSDIRLANEALRRGDMTKLADSSSAGVFAFRRHTGIAAEDVVVILNTSQAEINVSVPVTFWDEDDVLENILYKEFGLTNNVTVKSGKLATSVEAMSMKIFKKQP